ncbi:MAG: flagellar hook capping FlgD N-terminal domain-containing protein [Litoreibacter sp.]
MEITTSTTGVNAAQTAAAADQEALSTDFETFIRMLTVQMENQDPLNPLDSQDFATQLATFSGVEQQVKTNDLIEALSSQMLTSGLGDMARWVGLDARVTAPANFDGSPVEILPTVPTIASSAQLVVTNANGVEVQRLNVPASDEPISWAGVDAQGNPFPSGQYAFAIEASSNGAVIDTSTPEIYARVQEVRIQDGVTVVGLNGGSVLPSSAVTGLRS